MSRPEQHGAFSRPRRARAAVVALFALALTLLNAIKPLHIDDPFNYRIAERAAQHPSDPYGFDILWLQWPQPVYEEVTPPVLPYWWALGLRLLGDREVLWKLWLAPFALLFVGSLSALARRLAPGAELAVLALATFGPVVLPGFNLMQDVPAAALGLAALALYLRAGDRGSLLIAAAAGIVAGLAMQTKYVAVTFLGAALLHGVATRRWRLTAVAGGCAALVFLCWEWRMTLVYGTGMLVSQLQQDLGWLPRSGLALDLLRLVGATLPALALVGVAALGASRTVVDLLSLAVAAGFALLWVAAVQEALYVGLGVGVILVVVAGCARLLRSGGSALSAPPRPPLRPGDRRAADAMLVGWILLELVVYFAASPFPAVRRVLGLGLAVTLVTCRLWTRAPAGRAPLLAPVALGVTLGLLVWATDLEEARAQRDVVAASLEATRTSPATTTIPSSNRGQPSGAVWFVGHWGFQYYAEKAGMRAVVPDRSRLDAGDWLVVPLGVDRQDIEPIGLDRYEIELTTDDLVPAGVLTVPGRLPLSTGFGYYAGSLPLTHRDRPRQEVRLFRVTRDYVPRTAWDAKWIAKWAFDAKGRTAAAALPALIHQLSRAPTPERIQVAEALAKLGPLAAPAVMPLIQALGDDEPAVRASSATALGRIGTEARPARQALAGLRTDSDPAVRQAASQALVALSR